METYIGYVYDGNQHENPILFEGTYENVSNFIMNNSHTKVVITDRMDNFVVSTVPGGFLDRMDQERINREELLKVLLPYQYGEKELMDFPLNEAYAYIGEQTVAVHINGDNDFEYSIFGSDMSLIDGGVIDNPNYWNHISLSVFENIKEIHNLKEDIKPQSLREIQKEEAYERMEYLRLNNDVIDEFVNDKLCLSFGPMGELKGIDKNQQEKIDKFESEYDAVVYHAIQDDYKFRDGQQFEMTNFLYVSKYLEEWNEDREILKDGYAYAYTYNHNVPEYSEIGEIGISPKDGGLIRDDKSYNFEPLNTTEFAKKIDDFNRHVNPIGYQSKEFYKGRNYDEIFSSIRNGRFYLITNELKALSDSTSPFREKAKELLSDIEAYSKNFVTEIKMSGISHKHGLKS